MSLEVMGLVWGTTLADSEMVVALALADRGDDDGVSWPSVEWLAWKTNKAERTVQAALIGLVGKKVLKREEVPGVGTYSYLQLDALKAIAKPKPRKRARLTPGPVNPRSGCGGRETEPPQATTGEPPQPLHPIREDKPKGSEADASEPRARARKVDFPVWWAAWPHQVDEPSARAEWERMAAGKDRPLLAEVLDGTGRYWANRPAGREPLNPASFLRGRRWADRPVAVGVKAAAKAGRLHEIAMQTEMPVALFDAACAACGGEWAKSYLAGAKLDEGGLRDGAVVGRRLTPWSHTGWQVMRRDGRFLALLEAEGIELIEPPPRRASG